MGLLVPRKTEGNKQQATDPSGSAGDGRMHAKLDLDLNKPGPSIR